MSGSVGDAAEVDGDSSNRRVSRSVEELLSGISIGLQRRQSVDSDTSVGGRGSAGYSSVDQAKTYGRRIRNAERGFLTQQSLRKKVSKDLEALRKTLAQEIKATNNALIHCLKVRDKHLRKRSVKYDLITAYLQAMSPKRSVDTQMRFSSEPLLTEGGFHQWFSAMRMASTLKGGIPPEFRKKLWIALADNHMESKKIDWDRTKWSLLNERSNPDDDKLGAQIVKDLHRTGCSLFSGHETEHNQSLLKMILLAYARWNKLVGYCQGFNMLAAILLEVTEWQEDEALKVMIYLIEGVLPEGYFTQHMRDLSVDMAVFRELLSNKYPTLSEHLNKLQMLAQDTVTGTSYEPPLINVFTMQWFLTIFSNCLPKSTVLRVWDLLFLGGNEILLQTALTIWGGLEKRVMAGETADEFYSIMGSIAKEMVEIGIMETDDFIKAICHENVLSVSELNTLRDKYTYNIRPLSAASALVDSPVVSRGNQTHNKKKTMKLFFSDDEEDMDDIAMATWCLSNSIQMQKNKEAGKPGLSEKQNLSSKPSKEMPNAAVNQLSADRMSVDISALKKHYAKIKQRQKQAHIIMTGALANQVSSRQPLQTAISHLLVGKEPIVRKSKAVPRIQFGLKGTKTAIPSAKHAKRSPEVVFQTKPPTLEKDSTGSRDQRKKTSRCSESSFSCDDDIYESLEESSPVPC